MVRFGIRVDGCPIRVDVVLDLAQRFFLSLRLEQMSKPSLRAQVFLDGPKPIRNQCVSHFAVDRFLQWPESGIDRQPRDVVT